jgi:hypothetical protein
VESEIEMVVRPWFYDEYGEGDAKRVTKISMGTAMPRSHEDEYGDGDAIRVTKISGLCPYVMS